MVISASFQPHSIGKGKSAPETMSRSDLLFRGLHRHGIMSAETFRCPTGAASMPLGRVVSRSILSKTALRSHHYMSLKSMCRPSISFSPDGHTNCWGHCSPILAGFPPPKKKKKDILQKMSQERLQQAHFDRRHTGRLSDLMICSH